MNISLIHIVEAITLFLIAGKLFQIWRLYRNATRRAEELARAKKNARAYLRQPYQEQASYISPAQAIETELYRKFRANYSNQRIPLPEVTYSEGLPLPEVTYSEFDMIQPTPELVKSFSTPKTTTQSNKQKSNSQQTAENAAVHQHKRILNDYIEDLFYESKPDIFSADVLEFKDYKLDANAEDEFITVEDEHAEFVRAFDSLDTNLCVAR